MSASLGDPIRAFGGDPKFKKLAIVKNQAIADAATGILSDENSQASENKKTLSRWSSKFLGLQPERERITGSEVSALDRYYNGDLERTMAGDRAGYAAKRQEVEDRLLGMAGVRNKLSALKSGGGDAGYLRSAGARDAGNIMMSSAMDEANMTRDDRRYLEALKTGMLGRRNSLLDATANDMLIPMQAMNAETARRSGMLSGLTSIDEANTMYGAQQHKTGLDKWAELGNSIGRISMDAASTYGAAMNGGGAQAQQSPYNMQGNPFGNQFGGGGSYFGGPGGFQSGGGYGTMGGGSLGFGNMNLGGYSMGGGGGGGGGLDMTGGMGTGGL